MKNLKENNKRKRPSTKQKIFKPVPNFKSLEEEAHFWDVHDTAEYDLENLDETIEVAGPLKTRVEKKTRRAP